MTKTHTTPSAAPHELTVEELKQAGGGYKVELKNVIVSSYSLESGSMNGPAGIQVPIKVKHNV